MHEDSWRAQGAGGAVSRPSGSAVTAGRANLEVVRSDARRRSSSATVRDGRIVVRVPAHLSASDERRTVDQLLDRLRARATRELPSTSLPAAVAPRSTREARGPRGDRLLVDRADAVAQRHLEDVRATEVLWSHRMSTRWASCTTPPGRIRVSHRLADAPDVVLDNILLHELAHIVVPNHGAAFQALVGRDPAAADVSAWLARRSRVELRRALGVG